MKTPTKQELDRLREQYPKGCRVVLDHMDDKQAPPIGTEGTVRGVDDIGSIMVSWDSGSSLSVVLGEDRCHRIDHTEEEPTMESKLFELGQLVITPNAQRVLDTLDANGMSEMFVALIGRHAKGDWGEISDDSKEANDASVKNGGDMILSAYDIGGTRFWIITEHDRSVTTILLPEDY